MSRVLRYTLPRHMWIGTKPSLAQRLRQKFYFHNLSAPDNPVIKDRLERRIGYYQFALLGLSECLSTEFQNLPGTVAEQDLIGTDGALIL